MAKKNLEIQKNSLEGLKKIMKDQKLKLEEIEKIEYCWAVIKDCRRTKENIAVLISDENDKLRQAKERIEATGAATDVLKAEARKLMVAVEDEEAETDLKEGGLRDAQQELKQKLGKLNKEMREIGIQHREQEKVAVFSCQKLRDLKKQLEERETQERKALAKLSTGDEGEEFEIVLSWSKEEIAAKIKLMENKEKQTIEFDKEILIENQKKFIEKKNMLKALKIYINSLGEMKSKRLENYMMIRSNISASVSREFARKMNQGQAGTRTWITLKIDHKKKEIQLEFSDSEGELVNKEISSLSGGEKSFIQIVAPPFRALDEWDVFLDPRNRKEIAETLIEAGLQQSQFQFIFISPQSTGEMQVQSKVEVREIVKSQ